ncbi:MAG: hypothetical protein ACP5QO_13360, partial [Clostridia bacterium]
MGLGKTIQAIILASSVAVMALSIVVMSPGVASASCDSLPQSERHIMAQGPSFSANTVYGVRANMNTAPISNVCSDSFAWDMLLNTATTGGTDFAQVGFDRQAGQSASQIFWEDATNKAPNPVVQVDIYPSSAGTYQYSVVYNGSNSTWTFAVVDSGGSTVFSKTVGSLDFTPNWVQWSGEVWAWEDYVPGTVSTHENFTSLEFHAYGIWNVLTSYPTWVQQT